MTLSVNCSFSLSPFAVCVRRSSLSGWRGDIIIRIQHMMETREEFVIWWNALRKHKTSFYLTAFVENIRGIILVFFQNKTKPLVLNKLKLTSPSVSAECTPQVSISAFKKKTATIFELWNGVGLNGLGIDGFCFEIRWTKSKYINEICAAPGPFNLQCSLLRVL